MKVKLEKGTSVSFEGTAHIYHVDYPDLLYCQDCRYDHDCYEEPYVAVYEVIRTSMPLSKLKHVFDANGYGRKFDHTKEVE